MFDAEKPYDEHLDTKIAEGTGTGDLDGITGEGTIVIGADGGHSYTLDYDIG